MQYIIITKKRVLQVEGKSLTHVTQACLAANVRTLSVTELKEED